MKRVKSDMKLEENACAVLASMFSGDCIDSISLQSKKPSPISQEHSINDESSEREFKCTSQKPATDERCHPSRERKLCSSPMDEKSLRVSQRHESRQHKRQKVVCIPQVVITKLASSNETKCTVIPKPTEELHTRSYDCLPNGKHLLNDSNFPHEPEIMSDKNVCNYQFSEFGRCMEQIMVLRDMELFPFEYYVAGRSGLGFIPCEYSTSLEQRLSPLFQNGDKKRLVGHNDYADVAHPSAAPDVLGQAVSEQMEVLLRVMGCSEASQMAVEMSNTSIGGSRSKTWLSRKKVQEFARSYQFMAPKDSFIYMI